MDSRTMGDDASDELDELGKREWPWEVNVGVVGEGISAEDVDDVVR